jgi:endoglucanase
MLKKCGFNSVRLTLSANVMLNLDSLKVNGANESLNPGINSMTAGQHLDDLVERLAKEDILVMLNLHRMTGEGDNAEDIGPYWYSTAYPESRIMEAWVNIAKRYVNKPNVFAMDIKNEPHGSTWGTGDTSTDFANFCQRVGNAILQVNPNVFIGVAGVTKCVWSDSVGQHPVSLIRWVAYGVTIWHDTATAGKHCCMCSSWPWRTAARPARQGCSKLGEGGPLQGG